MTKQCSRCRRRKDITEYSRSKARKDGLVHICKPCMKIYRREHYRRNRKRLRAEIKKRKGDIRSWFQDFKKTLKCQRCGETEPCCLDFHHKDPRKKTNHVGAMMHRGSSRKVILAEAKKCLILCSNCHRKLHAGVV